MIGVWLCRFKQQAIPPLQAKTFTPHTIFNFALHTMNELFPRVRNGIVYIAFPGFDDHPKGLELLVDQAKPEALYNDSITLDPKAQAASNKNSNLLLLIIK